MTSYKTFCNLLLKHPRMRCKVLTEHTRMRLTRSKCLHQSEQHYILKNYSMIKGRPSSNSNEQRPAHSQTNRKAQGYSFLSKSSLLLSSRS